MCWWWGTEARKGLVWAEEQQTWGESGKAWWWGRAARKGTSRGKRTGDMGDSGKAWHGGRRMKMDLVRMVNSKKEKGKEREKERAGLVHGKLTKRIEEII
ncbi:hypothetical protein SLEP1_g56193 [Rubroshorea leprosula]|uniref:Uncharacterized protein n=1 Tax=Rubroshorea leprosula TaxID=152421 RepID=A0AAV5MIV9_9ROSI|nr:hypothetical protein SLEP1_g56193 [Rubroshorea leprosula]